MFISQGDFHVSISFDSQTENLTWAAEALATVENAPGHYQDGYQLRVENLGKDSSPIPILINIALSDSVSGLCSVIFKLKVLYP